MSAEEAVTPDAPDFVDEITNMLSRVWPGEVESGELEQEIGASPEELRTATEWMREHDLLDDEGEHFKIAHHGGSAPGGIPEHDPPPEEDLDAADQVKAATRAPVSGELPVRVVFTLSTSFGRAEGESDDAVVKRCEALFEQIQETLGAGIPKMEMVLDVEEIETFDQPRRIFPSKE